MVTTRTPIKRGKHARITPEVIEAYRHARALHNNPKAREEWESEGGRRREYLDTCSLLHDLLGRQTWDEQILDTIGQDDIEDVPTGAYAPFDIPSWKEAVTIRLELERLSKDVMDSHR
jgi:hypothetical protein